MRNTVNLEIKKTNELIHLNAYRDMKTENLKKKS